MAGIAKKQHRNDVHKSDSLKMKMSSKIDTDRTKKENELAKMRHPCLGHALSLRAGTK